MAVSPPSVSDPYSRSRATPPSGKIFSRTWVAGWPVTRNRCGVSGSSRTGGSSSRHADLSVSETPAVASSVCSEAVAGWLPRYQEVSISARSMTPWPASRMISYSCPDLRRLRVSQPSPITRDRPGEMALRGAEK